MCTYTHMGLWAGYSEGDYSMWEEGCRLKSIWKCVPCFSIERGGDPSPALKLQVHPSKVRFSILPHMVHALGIMERY